MRKIFRWDNPNHGQYSMNVLPSLQSVVEVHPGKGLRLFASTLPVGGEPHLLGTRMPWEAPIFKAEFSTGMWRFWRATCPWKFPEADG